MHKRSGVYPLTVFLYPCLAAADHAMPRLVPGSRRCPAATGVIVGPNESLRDIFPEGSDPQAWRQAIEAVLPRNSVKDIEARCVDVSPCLHLGGQD